MSFVSHFHLTLIFAISYLLAFPFSLVFVIHLDSYFLSIIVIAIKREEDPFWDQCALMEMGKKPSNLYVEVMSHESKLFGPDKDVLLAKLQIPLRKFVRGIRFRSHFLMEHYSLSFPFIR